MRPNKSSKNAKKVSEAIDLISLPAAGLTGNTETRARCGRSVRKPDRISGGLLLALHQQVSDAKSTSTLKGSNLCLLFGP